MTSNLGLRIEPFDSDTMVYLVWNRSDLAAEDVPGVTRRWLVWNLVSTPVSKHLIELASRWRRQEQKIGKKENSSPHHESNKGPSDNSRYYSQTL